MSWNRKLLHLVLCVVLLLSVALPAAGAAETKTRVRVGFPIQSGISYLDEEGNHAGYLVDYLEHLSLYANWDIEYVQVEGDLNTQIITLMEMLDRGEIDLMGTMTRSPELEERFLYPSYSYGTTYTTLAVRETDTQWLEEDCTNWDGITVATYPGLDNRMELLEPFARLNGFSFQVVEYQTHSQVIQAVLSGQADATVQVDISMSDGLRPIAHFSPDFYYFALSRHSAHLLQTLNLAMHNLNQSFPYLQTQLYFRYFGYTPPFSISGQEREALQDLGTLRVLFFDGNPPYQYIKQGELKGAAVDYMADFAQKTGLTYQPVVAYSYQEGVELVEQGQVDVVACLPTNCSLAELDSLRLSMPYLVSESVLVSQTGSEAASSPLPFSLNASDALELLRTRQSSVQRVDTYSADYYLQKKGLYPNLAADRTSNMPFSYTVAIASPLPTSLLTLLNRYASSLSLAQRQELVYRYSNDQAEYTAAELLYLYRYEVIFVPLVLVLLAGLAFYYRRARLATRGMAAANHRLNYLSSYDTLTGAHNENYFRQQFQLDCQNRIPITLLALNIRDFKYINETFGVSTADQFLCRMKDALDQMMGPGEFFCRQSADVFYLALREDTTGGVVGRIRELYSHIQHLSDQLLDGYTISLYCGAVITSVSPDAFSHSSNFSYMLAALAHAKRRKSDSLCFYSQEIHQMEQSRHYVESHMQSALEQEEFLLYLQPKMNLHTGQIDKAEALVRWQPKDRPMLYPNQFIPIFEENGFCIQLDLYMVEQVCKQLRTWMDQGLPPIAISVNQTRLLFSQGDYVEQLQAITRKYEIPPAYLTLEILESLALDSIDRLNHVIHQLKQAGFSVSLDDFGSGYSSLNVLADLNIDELKVDREFLRNISQKFNHPRRQVIMEQITQMAQKIHVATVAEGVETSEDDSLIKGWKYNYGQGYYYGRPIPAHEFQEAFLAPSHPKNG